MKPKRYIPVNSCKDCPHRGVHAYNWRKDWCILGMGKTTDFIGYYASKRKIPKWCPLPEWEET